MNTDAKWSVKRLDEIGTIYSGATPSTTKQESWDGEIVWVTPSDLSRLNTAYLYVSGKKLSESGLKNCSAHLMPARSIVISSRAPIGYVAIPLVDFCTNQGCKSIKLRSIYDSEFTYYNISFHIEKLKNVGEGTTFAEISKAALEKIELPFPDDKREQSEIASVLCAIDRAIEQTEALIAKQQRIKIGLMQDLLTKGIDEHGNIRSEATHAFKDSPLGRIPVEWACQTAGALLSGGILSGIQDGNHGELHPKSSNFVPEGVPFVMASDIVGGVIDFARAKRITEAQYRTLRIGFAQPRDVLLSHKASIGFVAIVPDDALQVMLTPQVTYYRVGNSEQMSYRYLAQFFRSERFQEPLKSLAKQSTRDYIGILAQQNLHIAYPLLIAEQGYIANLLDDLDRTVAAHSNILNKLRVLKNGLMNDLLTGERCVTALLGQTAT